MPIIKFNQQKYVIPLIIIPFNIFIFYLVRETFGNPTQAEKGPEEVNAINTTIPLPNLQRRPMKNKFDSFTEAYKDTRSYSSIKEIDRQEEKINAAEKAKIDSVNDVLLRGEQQPFMDRVNARMPKANTVTKTSSLKQESKTDYDNQMQLFKDQMRYTDSLTRAGNPVEAEEPIPAIMKKDQPETFKIYKVNQQSSAYFNTIRPWKKEQTIQAMIDEDIKVFPGSRVKIRLLDDVEVNGMTIEKGQYLYGTVSAFKPQRIEITVNSVLNHDEVIPVWLAIYDNDGLPGLYVPSSKFRELTKDMASNMVSGQSLQLPGSPENQMEMLYNMAEKAFSTAARSAGNAARKNKAHLKYNTILYLVNQNN